MKLKRKIFLIFSLVAVIPMIFLTTYTVVQYTHMIDNRMEDISHEQQENLSDAIDASYTSIRQVFMLLTFASNTDSSIIKILRPYADPEIHMTNMEIYRACLQLRNANQNIFYTYDFLNGVYVYTPSGNLISYETSKNGTIAQTYNPKNDDWYNRTIESGEKCITALWMNILCLSPRIKVSFFLRPLSIRIPVSFSVYSLSTVLRSFSIWIRSMPLVI